MWVENIQNRTFGYELEFADADKTLIDLPAGYKWTDNKMTMMNNSDGSSVTHSGKFGGEINTRPYNYSEEDLEELKNFIQQIKDAGGYLMWNEGFDAHLYIADLGLDFFKRLFALSFYTAFPIKKIFDIAEWWDTKYLVPSPTEEVLRLVLNANSVENLVKVFSNSSDRGHIRYWLNLVPVTKIGTAEFRIFNSSWDFEKVKETIKFMYSFAEYAYLNEDISEYSKLNTVEACLSAFKIDYDKVPQRHEVLPWAAEHNDNVTVVGESFKKTAKMLDYIKKLSSRFKKVKVVNSMFADIEQIVSQEVEVYTKEYFIFLLYEIIQGKVQELKFVEEFSFMDIESENRGELVATLLLFNQIKKHNKSDDIYHKALYDDYVKKYDHYLKKYAERYTKMVDILCAKKITVYYGYDLEDAVLSAGPDDLIIYQSEFNSNIRAAGNAVRVMVTNDFGWIDKKPTPYANIDLEAVNYILITQHQFMGRKKVFRDGRTCLYSNVGNPGDNVFNRRSLETLKYKRLPDDFKITNKSKLKFIRASMSEIDYLRMIYLKKNIILGSAPFCYLWFIDDYVFGATMYDFIKVQKYGFDAVTMKSDFVIDSDIPKLSKLLIMGVLSEEYKAELDIRFKQDVGTISTSVFTDKPVSMKYRGVFDLSERGSGVLYYTQKAGILGSLEEIIKQFVKKHAK